MLTISYELDLKVSEAALAAVSGASGANRSGLHKAMAEYVGMLTTDYLEDEQGTSHMTAGRLNANPTGFFPKVAGFVKAARTEDGVMLTMPRAGVSRAFFTYILRPVRSRLLTIPLKAVSYGKRAREFKNLQWRKFTDADVAEGKSDTAGLVLGSAGLTAGKKKRRKKGDPAPGGGMFIALFAGAREVTIKQDRNLLPDDEDWLLAAEVGFNEYLKAALK